MGPIIHYRASKLLSKELGKVGITYQPGDIIDNIVPDFEVSHGFHYPEMQGNLLTVIDKEITALSSWYNEHKEFNTLHIRFLLHYIMDSLSIGQIDQRFWVKYYGISRDDLIDFISEFSYINIKSIALDLEPCEWDDIKQDIYFNIRNTHITYIHLLDKINFKDIQEMNRVAIRESVKLVIKILLKIKELNNG